MRKGFARCSALSGFARPAKGSLCRNGRSRCTMRCQGGWPPRDRGLPGMQGAGVCLAAQCCVPLCGLRAAAGEDGIRRVTGEILKTCSPPPCRKRRRTSRRVKSEEPSCLGAIRMPAGHALNAYYITFHFKIQHL